MIYRAAPSRTSSIDIASTSRTILAEWAFNLRKFNSKSKFKCETEVKTEGNHRETLVKEEDSSYANTMVRNLPHHNNWNNDSDEFCFQFKDIIAYSRNLPVTKFSLFRVCGKSFDPLGHYALFLCE